ncbi:hypothetical protein HPB52_023844 [Rhipicephalus sanguineus]|uniref:Uncharacterized protein n=1 Tax=Rhipicephalus sanguineus TaxID=34632 RepID=A0A9D4SV34_RHISA|nr:hypothetical protein HPB52_023844 [Rhipicephalus sanguineus]
MSSDPIEAMFGFLRRSAGCDDALDIRSTICSLEKMLKTGIIAASSGSNVQSSATFTSTQLLPIQQVRCTSTPTAADLILNTAAMHLREHLLSNKPILSNPDIASLAMIGGFIVRAVSERIACAECIAMLQAPNSSAPNHGLITHQDRGGLYYPTQELVKVLVGLRRLADCVLSQRRSVKKPLEACVQRSVQELMSLPVLSCGNTDLDHRKVLLELIARKLIKPLFSSYAQGKTDTNATVKFLEKKPLSRKILKL